MRIVAILLFLLPASTLLAQQTKYFQAMGSPVDPKVNVSWNRYYTYEGITEICKQIANAHPNLAKLSSIGKSFQGRDMWILTITNFKNGSPDKKPGFYMDGNIHSNEIQGSEMSLYTAWYLTEMFASNSFIKNLLDEKVFYIVPTINPDARNNYMTEANTAHSPRSGLLPVDNDRDGQVNEDGYEDINGDGTISLMRRKNKLGRFKEDPNDPRRLIQVPIDEQGEYEILGIEGIDNDGDGLVNEDGEGFYDPNRDWGWNWQPNYIQPGAYKYPFSIPENKNVRDFVLRHPNIAGGQTFHNWGGMILRGPGAAEDANTYSHTDVAVYDAIGRRGEEMLPGYRYIVMHSDLYTVYGGEVDWFHNGRGIFMFSNELFVEYMYFNEKSQNTQIGANMDQGYKFDKYLLFGDAFIPWKEYDHPQLGKIEIGGFKKNFTRNDPGFLLESYAHRNMAFCLYHASEMPKLEVTDVEEKSLGAGVVQVTATIYNHGIIPTHSSFDIRNKISLPNLISLEGAKVLSGMIVINRAIDETIEQSTNPQRIQVTNIPGKGFVTVRWIVTDAKKYTINVESPKGGIASWSK